MMRKLILGTAACLVLASCSGSSETPAEKASTPVVSETAAPEATTTSDVTDAEDKLTETVSDAAEEVTEAVASDLDPEIAAKLAALPAPYNEADYKKGNRLYKQCATCHLLEEGAGNRVGPNLHGVVGRISGHVSDFNYSKTMAESGIEWTPDQLEAYLENPRKFLPGNRMSFAGLRKPDDRRDVIAYLMIEAGTTPAE